MHVFSLCFRNLWCPSDFAYFSYKDLVFIETFTFQLWYCFLATLWSYSWYSWNFCVFLLFNVFVHRMQHPWLRRITFYTELRLILFSSGSNSTPSLWTWQRGRLQSCSAAIMPLVMLSWKSSNHFINWSLVVVACISSGVSGWALLLICNVLAATVACSVQLIVSCITCSIQGSIDFPGIFVYCLKLICLIIRCILQIEVSTLCAWLRL